HRRKQGFAVPIEDWFMDALGGEIRSTLESFMAQSDLFDPTEVRRVLAGGHAREAWYLFNFARWARDYGVSA
ncbi:MAG: asparagine synthetase B, partial [Alphaproteobacteria bacterium]|nr:asparagine synthetase B [Alphaproteobacteria bacterium]